MRQSLDMMLADDTPMVRKSAAAALPDMVKVVTMDQLSSFVVPLYKRLVGDDQDSVRIAAIEASLHVARGLQQTGIDEQNILHVVPVVRSALEDRSWRVRLAIAKDFTDLCRAIVGDGGQRTTEILHHDLVPAFAALLQDNEGYVTSNRGRGVEGEQARAW
jgi:serine/threonine-protein phosphatase 2A regulatory subunit A